MASNRNRARVPDIQPKGIMRVSPEPMSSVPEVSRRMFSIDTAVKLLSQSDSFDFKSLAVITTQVMHLIDGKYIDEQEACRIVGITTT